MTQWISCYTIQAKHATRTDGSLNVQRIINLADCSLDVDQTWKLSLVTIPGAWWGASYRGCNIPPYTDPAEAFAYDVGMTLYSAGGGETTDVGYTIRSAAVYAESAPVFLRPRNCCEFEVVTGP